MRASVLGTGRRLPARARVKVRALEGMAVMVRDVFLVFLLKPEARFLLYPALSMMVTVSGDDARHASDHDTKGHALCVPSPCSIRHACALIHPCMRFLILPMHETIHTRCLRLVMLALTAFVCL